MSHPDIINHDLQTFGLHPDFIQEPPSEHDLITQRIEFRKELMKAIGKVKRLYPGPAGEVLYRELNSWVEFGSLFDGKPLLITDLVATINATLLPKENVNA